MRPTSSHPLEKLYHQAGLKKHTARSFVPVSRLCNHPPPPLPPPRLYGTVFDSGGVTHSRLAWELNTCPSPKNEKGAGAQGGREAKKPARHSFLSWDKNSSACFPSLLFYAWSGFCSFMGFIFGFRSYWGWFLFSTVGHFYFSSVFNLGGVIRSGDGDTADQFRRSCLPRTTWTRGLIHITLGLFLSKVRRINQKERARETERHQRLPAGSQLLKFCICSPQQPLQSTWIPSQQRKTVQCRVVVCFSFIMM